MARERLGFGASAKDLPGAASIMDGAGFSLDNLSPAQ
jgi:hypothetical protein